MTLAAARKLRSGFVRFATFDALALLFALALIWDNPLPWNKDEAHILPLALAKGACLGMLSALAAQLAVERRKWPTTIARLIPALCGVAMAALGTLFWYHVRETSIRFTCWYMLYWGSLVSIGALAAAQLFDRRNAWTVFGRVFLSAVFVCLITLAVNLGLTLCVEAYKGLIAQVSNDLLEDVTILTWCAMAPTFMAALLPKDNEPTEQPKAFNVLFWFLLPIGIVLLAILYAYIAKIVVTWSMPSGKMNWFASWALAAYLFFWLSLRGSRIRFFAFVARWGWVALIPVVATQIVGIAIRYNAYGLTTSRMAGMATLAVGVYALGLAAFDRSARSALVLLAALGILLTMSPFNIVDVPMRQQSARLRSALERAGCLADGSLTVPEKPDIHDEDAKVIAGAWEYLTKDELSRQKDDDNKPPLRQGVWQWHGNAFARSVAESTLKLTGKKRPDLVGLLNINMEKVKGKMHRTTNIFRLDNYTGPVDISGFKTMEEKAEKSSGLYYEGGKYFISLAKDLKADRHDVTAHVKRLMENSGANANYTDGRYHPHTLKAADAVWELTPKLSIAISRISLQHPPERQTPDLGKYNIDYYILRR